MAIYHYLITSCLWMISITATSGWKANSLSAGWSSWETTSPCSVSCGIGSVVRTRKCIGHTRNCIGDDTDFIICDAGCCPVKAEWCAWSNWSDCRYDCEKNVGTRTRNRKCECPVAHDGGNVCDGTDFNEEKCYSNGTCSLNGGWSEWSHWSACSSELCTLSPGYRKRTRRCDNPPPQRGGSCEGQDFETRACVQMDGCEVEGVYDMWASWSPCTRLCGSCSYKIRHRRCSQTLNVPDPDVDVIGQPRIRCNGMEKVRCLMPPCPDGTDSCDEQQTDESNDEDYEPYERDERKEETTSDFGPYYAYGYDYYSGDYNDGSSPSDSQNAFDANSILALKPLDDDNGHEDDDDEDDDDDDDDDHEYGNYDDEENKSFNTKGGDKTDSSPPSYDAESHCQFFHRNMEYEKAEGCCRLMADWNSASLPQFLDTMNSTQPKIKTNLDVHNLTPEVEQDSVAISNSSTLITDAKSKTQIVEKEFSAFEDCLSLDVDSYVGTLIGNISARSFLPSCRLRNRPRHLRAICCVYPDCSGWKKPNVLGQCRACWASRLCQCAGTPLSG